MCRTVRISWVKGNIGAGRVSVTGVCAIGTWTVHQTIKDTCAIDASANTVTISVRAFITRGAGCT